MKAIHAIYERGVFRPLEAIDLPEATEVVFEPRPVLTPPTPEARARVMAVLAQRFDSQRADVAENILANTDSLSLLELADHAEPMGSLTNAQIDQAVYGG